MSLWMNEVCPAGASSIAPPCASSRRTPEPPAAWRDSITPTSVRASAVAERVRDVGRAGGEGVVTERPALALRPALRPRLAEAAGEDQLRLQVGMRVLRERRAGLEQRLDRLAGRGPVPRYCPNTSTAAECDPVETEQIAASGAGADAQRAVKAATISAARDHG